VLEKEGRVGVDSAARHHPTKTYEIVEVKLYTFLISALYGGE
jgi:hypothetical protein